MKNKEFIDFLSRKIKKFPKKEDIVLSCGYDKNIKTYFLIINTAKLPDEIIKWKSNVRDEQIEYFRDIDLCIITKQNTIYFNIEKIDIK